LVRRPGRILRWSRIGKGGQGAYNAVMAERQSRKVLSVSDVNRLVAGMLGEFFSDVWVEGEVSNFKAYPSGHFYFALKDMDAQLPAVCFRSAAAKLRFRPEDGMQVVVHGRLDLYQVSGKFQIVVDWMEPKGAGALQKAFEQLKKKLAAEGLFAEERKRPLPRLVRVLGIVTSPAGAAIHDMLTTLGRHRAPIEVVLYPAQVQGEGAAEQIAEGLRVLNGRGGVDAIIVGRGGGSIEDLWPFNEEVVARAIAASPVPVISAVGHEVDFTISDFVADVRAATPTAAAELVAGPWEEVRRGIVEAFGVIVESIEQLLADGEQRLETLVKDRAFEVVRSRLIELRQRVERQTVVGERAVRQKVRMALARWNELGRRLTVQHPGERLARQRARLQVQLAALERRMTMSLVRSATRLARSAGRLDGLSPLASLGRGYSICQKPDGAVVTSVGQVEPGDRIGVRVSDGRLECDVMGKQEESGK